MFRRKRKPEDITREELLREYVNVPHSDSRKTAKRLGLTIRDFTEALKIHGFSQGNGKFRTPVEQMANIEWLKSELKIKPLNQIAREIGATSGNLSDFCKRRKLLTPRIYNITKVGTSAKWWKRKLLAEIGKCERCGWDEHPEILDLHHSDLNPKNNTRENVKLLCPNCHVWVHYQNGTGRYAMGKSTKGKKGKDHPRFGNNTSYDTRMKELKSSNGV